MDSWVYKIRIVLHEPLPQIYYMRGLRVLHPYNYTDEVSPQILNDALGAVNHTPLIRPDKFAERFGLRCNLCK